MSFFTKLNPAGGVADFWSEFRRPNPYRWPILFASVLITGGILSMIIWDEVRIPPPRPKVTYISTFAEGRTDAEIAASNLANQRLQDERQAEYEARLERQRDAYRALGRATGIDVEAIDERVARERAAEQAAQEAERRKLLGQTVDDSSE
ncbi:hypothetical protein U4960_14245 [Altererythrobacter sp. H2]|uniref:hypothetical protein n=1 Tax=Altererythrobacter sp. H2 TaxID=3108391 RepID=UPI002B4BC14F|nr:hypothetical protein [Altererythrobacter sp. H2]WRK95429.1 hypothetical protein U4960_14245 [Altererythrobacter sp. H2]